MTKIKFTIFIVLVITLTSCTRIYMALHGIHNPKLENETSINKFLDKMGLRSDNVYVIRDTANYFSLHRSKQFAGIPEMWYFNKEGYFMQIRNPDECNSQNSAIIRSLSVATNYDVDSTLTIGELLPYLKALHGQNVSQDLAEGNDIYAIIFWAMYAGSLNKKVRNWEGELYNAFSSLKIKVLKVNMDLQESWNVPLDVNASFKSKE